ncbi:MAG: hypothetical protein ACXW0F_01410 [Gaiellaceae bacterium]
MKTRIIQDEPEAGEAPRPPDGDAGALQPGRTSSWLRRGVVSTAVVGYFVVGIVHPPDIKVGDDTANLYLLIHVLQPVLIGLLGWSLLLLVEGLPGRAAQIARYAVVPYLIAYTMLDTIAGIATPLIVREANSMSPADAATVQRMLDGMDDLIPFAIWLVSGLTWLLAAVATAVAVRQVGGRGPATLMALGAAIFAVGHPFPPGPIGIGLFGLGVLWLEVRRASASVPAPVPAPETQPVLAP